MEEIKGYACFETGGEVKPWSYTPRPLGPLDISIKISHCGICASDVHTIDSGWEPTHFPCIVGHEIVGTVTKVGGEVTDMAVGDRVGVGAQAFACLNCEECLAGRDQQCHDTVFTYNSFYEDGSQAQGGYAAAINLSSKYAFKIPENISSEHAAPLLCAGVTTYAPLKTHLTQEGLNVGVVGIGGLGHLALQWAAKVFNASVVAAISSSLKKKEDSFKFGANKFINVKDEKSIEEAKASLDVILVTTNFGNDWDCYLSLLRSRGKLVLVSLPEEDMKFNPTTLVFSMLSIHSSLIGSRSQIQEMLEMASKHNVRPQVQCLPMSKANDGISNLRKGLVRYRTVLLQDID